jgi:hypothetical protein
MIAPIVRAHTTGGRQQIPEMETTDQRTSGWSTCEDQQRYHQIPSDELELIGPPECLTVLLCRMLCLFVKGTRHQPFRQKGEVLPPPQLCAQRRGRSFASALPSHATRYATSQPPLELSARGLGLITTSSWIFFGAQDGASSQFVCSFTSWTLETSRWTSSITSR